MIEPPIELRETVEDDFPILFGFQADPEASAMAAFPSRIWPAFVEHQAKIAADPAATTRTILVDGSIVGSIGSWAAGDERDVGYWIGREYWGRGFATAALRAFLEVDMTRPMWAHAAEHNVGSRRVLEKAGFVQERQELGADGITEGIFVLPA